MKLWPARSKFKDLEPVADLDAIVAEPVTFRYQGKIHSVKPIRLDEFLKFTNAQSKLMEELKGEENRMTPRQLAERYHSVVNAVCDTLTIDDILTMEQAQVAALYQLVIDMVTGQVKLDGSQKKSRQKIPIYESVQPLSSPSVPENSDGQLKEH